MRREACPDICVCCGRVVPEGTQICRCCEHHSQDIHVNVRRSNAGSRLLRRLMGVQRPASKLRIISR